MARRSEGRSKAAATPAETHLLLRCSGQSTAVGDLEVVVADIEIEQYESQADSQADSQDKFAVEEAAASTEHNSVVASLESFVEVVAMQMLGVAVVEKAQKVGLEHGIRVAVGIL